MIFQLSSRALRLEERKQHIKTEKEPDGKIIETTLDAGWFLTLDLGGLGFSFALGSEKPTFPLVLSINVPEAPK